MGLMKRLALPLAVVVVAMGSLLAYRVIAKHRDLNENSTTA